MPSTENFRMRILLSILVSSLAMVSLAKDLTIVNATLVTEPGAQAQQNATIHIRDGQLVDEAEVKDDIPVLDARGRLVTAGLWNAHIHLTSPEVSVKPAKVMREMLLKYGFTSALDTGSDPYVMAKVQSEIKAGVYPAPKIVTTGGSLVYKDGTPSYLPGIQLPEVTSKRNAAAITKSILGSGADGIKIFSGSFQSPTETIWIPTKIIKAITKTAHKADGFVIAHPTDQKGLENAIEGGVDMLAHTAPPAGAWSDAFVANMIGKGVALVPTLKLWRWELSRFGTPPDAVTAYQQNGVRQLASFYKGGGVVMFGTDVGYMSDFDTAEEFELMTQAGMDFDGILAALTTNPASRLDKNNASKVINGEPGDLVIFSEDPRQDSRNFANIAVTVKAGRIVYESK